jgi:hypothetical protein
MRKNHLIALASIFGVFIMLNTPLLAQSTGTSEGKEAERESERATRSTRVIVAPEVPEIIGSRFDHDYGYVWTSGSSSERNTKLTLSKDFNGESTSKTGTFSVEQGVKKIRLSIHGSVKSGKIELELYLPGKKELKKISIDDSADIEWSQFLDIKEGDNKYFGEWTYVISAQNAKGFYSLSLNTY